MHPPYQVPIWKHAPTLRLLPALILGILLQWYLQFSLLFIVATMACFLTAMFIFLLLPRSSLYRFSKFRSLALMLLIAAVASLLTWLKDSRHHHEWYGWQITDSSKLLLVINEPLVVKQRSVKAEAMVEAVINGKNYQPAKGRLLLYFSKDTLLPQLRYGERIIIDKALQAINNSGNPGAFNYKRYAAFQQVFHQVFLKKEDWVSRHQFSANRFRQVLFDSRTYILQVLRQYINNDAQQLGIAEALLIGYKEDLDKDLVQAYSNTGVVHIIAISGLHLGLIYIVLTWLFNRIPYFNRLIHAKAILLIACLWLFALLTGGSASVLRSAVMFTVIVLGKYYFKQSSVYNSLAVSAFILLLYNPYYLWDVGFQLSYCAVIGIVAFQKYIFRLWYPPNRMLKWIWEMTSITLAAQLATFPVCIYYFHQFPIMFLFSNLIAVPVSTGILFGEILLIILAPFGFMARPLGWLIGKGIYYLNKLVLFFDGLPFSVWDFIYANILSTWLQYGLVVFLMSWFINRNKKWLYCSLVFAVGLSAFYVVAYIQQQYQKKIVVYNISRFRAVDFIDKGNYLFAGDTALQQAGLLQNFHLKPARIKMQATVEKDSLPSLFQKGYYWQFYDTRVLWIDDKAGLIKQDPVQPVDLLILSNNVHVEIKDLLQSVRPATIVFDGSNALWKIQKWKKDCEELLLRCHPVSEQGAFVLEIE